MPPRQYLYLFVLEVEPVETGRTYSELPLHCTLMHRFWSNVPADVLIQKVQPLCRQAAPVLLQPGAQEVYGPRAVTVTKVHKTDDLQALHTMFFAALNTIGVSYTEPDWVGHGYDPHVTHRADGRKMTHEQLSTAVYLVEVVDHERHIRARLTLG